MQGEGWRPCLFAVLLATSLADASGDPNNDIVDPNEDSRSGNVDLDAVDNDETRAKKGANDEAKAFAESKANHGVPGYLDDDGRHGFLAPDDWINENNHNNYKLENPGGDLLPGYGSWMNLAPQVNLKEDGPTHYFNTHSDGLKNNDNRFGDLKTNPIYVMENPQELTGVKLSPGKPFYPVISGNQFSQAALYDHDDSLIRDQYVKSPVPGRPVVYDNVVLPKDSTYETVPADNKSSKLNLRPSLLKSHKLFSKLIPLEKHILLSNIPGAGNIIKCTKEGEIHNFWAPGFQCMVCVCQRGYRRIRPVCVSCQSCLTPPEPEPEPTTQPSIPPPPPDDVRCKPLPVNVPFPSPIDPCKVCICTETSDQLGKMDARIQCHHNPQCVLPTTQPPSISTPLPLPICDKLPSNVPFPHPHDSCKICRCVVTRTPLGQLEREIVCYASPDCQPSTSTQTPQPDVTDLPPPTICDRYPDDVFFPHPGDQCQVCKCLTDPGLFIDKKKVTCYVRPNCIPDHHTTPEPETVTSEIDCNAHPENVPFPHPTDSCLLCKCEKDHSIFHFATKVICFANPFCNSSTTTAAPTPPPQPENVRCAPLPSDRPFQSPINPCQICTCTETANFIGRVIVEIKCQDNQQCVLPQNTTTLPPEIGTGVPLPACKNFPENVLFPHPSDACKVCRCYTQKNPFGKPEQNINCYTKQECLPTPPPPTPKPEPDDLCLHYPLDTFFPLPSDPCRTCKCHKNNFQMKAHITCFIKPECAPTPKPDATCAPLPTGKVFQHPLNPCQVCACTESEIGSGGEVEVLIECKENRQCVLPPDYSTISPDVTNHTKDCDKFPEDVYFPHPSDACKQCKCNLMQQQHSPPEQVMSCIKTPECLPPTPPPTTVRPPRPDPLHLCKRYPVDVIFPDPLDQCKLCKCYKDLSHGLDRLITCFVKPECLSTPRPPTTSEPESNIISCAPLPVGKLFQSPLNPCQICKCTERTDLFGRHDVKVECQVKPQCVIPDNRPEIPLIIVKPIRWPSCKNFPPHLAIPHPRDPCQRCQCAVHYDQSGKPVEYISCSSISECVRPTTTELPVANDVCGRYPINTPFDDPNDHCRTCKCTQIGSIGPGSKGLESAIPGRLFPPKYQIMCQTKPECLTTETPEPNSLCDNHQVEVPFDDPRDACRTCVCYWSSQGSAPAKGLGNTMPTKLYKCAYKPECLPTPPPTTEEPEPYYFCKNYPVDVPFSDPRDPCRSCVCYYTKEDSPGNAPGKGLPGNALTKGSGHAAPTRVKLFKCFLKPECHKPTAEPITIDPLSQEVSCKPLPSGTPFQSPLNPCQTCTCTETVDVFGRPGVVFKCRQKPQCVVPHDVTTMPPDSQIRPVPLPACAQFPTNVEFPHPHDACKFCRCTVQVSTLGTPEQHISCYTNPECEPGLTTVEPPESTKWPPAPPEVLPGPAPHESCSPYTPNEPFQHPWDDCQVCICREAISLERITIEINCYTKPSCCYEPPLEIQGSESLHMDGSQQIGGSASWIIPGSGSINQIYNWKYPNENQIGTASSNIIESAGENQIYSADDKLIKPSTSIMYRLPSGIQTNGENVIDYNGGSNVKSENWIKNQGETQIGYSENSIKQPVLMESSGGGNLIGSSNAHVIGSAGGNVIGISGVNVIEPEENMIGQSGMNLMEAAGNLVGSIGEDLYGSDSQSLIKDNGGYYVSNGGDLYGSDSQSLIKDNGGYYVSNGGDLYGSDSQSLIKDNGRYYVSNGGNSYGINGGFSGGITFGTNLKVNTNAKENHYVPNREYLPLRPTEAQLGPGLWKKPVYYQKSEVLDANAEGDALSANLNGNDAASAVVFQQRHSNKMKTKSARPSDSSDSEDYEE